MSARAIVKCWRFASSRGGHSYQTLLYADGSTSCECPGWCRRVAPDGSRSCKHTRAVVLGNADRECESAHDYHAQSPARIAAASRPNSSFGQIGRRRIQT
jgi:hypothetical protein